uniref:Uncharacterized protein n=1 Tax=Arundo donax TaxID=35708 RepID=A0A0A8ZSE0_ARUDO
MRRTFLLYSRAKQEKGFLFCFSRSFFLNLIHSGRNIDRLLEKETCPLLYL